MAFRLTSLAVVIGTNSHRVVTPLLLNSNAVSRTGRYQESSLIRI